MAQNLLPFQFVAGGGSAIVSPATQLLSNAPASNVPAVPGHAMPNQQLASAQSSQLSASDLEALSTVNPQHLAILARLFQSGVLPLPPAPPAPPAPTPAQYVDAIATKSADDRQEEQDENMDKEEGEVEEGDSNVIVKEREFLHPPPTGPRNKSPHLRDHKGLAQSRPMNGTSGAIMREPFTTQPSLLKPFAEMGRQQTDFTAAPPTKKMKLKGHLVPPKGHAVEAVSKDFILHVHNAGFSFDDLAKELTNVEPLRRMYNELGLPLPPVTKAAHGEIQDNGAKADPPIQTSSALSRSLPPITLPSPVETRKPSVTSRPGPVVKPSAPTNRSEYLAKLAAAKNKKTDVQAPKPAVSAATASSITGRAAAEKEVAPTDAVVHGTLPAKSLDKTELARQKLEALRARQIAKLLASGRVIPAKAVPDKLAEPAAMPSNGLQPFVAATTPHSDTSHERRGPAPIEPTPSSQAPIPSASVVEKPLRTAPLSGATPFSPAPPTPGRPFSSLPGLFMAPPPPPSAAPPPTSVTLPVPPAPDFTVAKPTADNEARKAEANGHSNHQQDVFNRADSKPSSVTDSSTSANSNAQASPIASPAPLLVSRKRPVASDFDEPTIDIGAPAAKRPFGPSRHRSLNEQIIIEESEDEDDERADRMDVDDSDNTSATVDDGAQQRPLRDMGPLRNFPPRPNGQSFDSTSVPATPGWGTPGGETYEKKMEELAEMKRKLVEMQERKKANNRSVKATVGEQDVAVQALDISTPTSQATRGEAMALPHTGPSLAQALVQSESPPSKVSAVARALSVERPSTASNTARQEERERLRLRLLELEQEDLRERSVSEAPLADIPGSKVEEGADHPQVEPLLETTISEQPAPFKDEDDTSNAAVDTLHADTHLEVAAVPDSIEDIRRTRVDEGPLQPAMEASCTVEKPSTPTQDAETESEASTAGSSAPPEPVSIGSAPAITNAKGVLDTDVDVVPTPPSTNISHAHSDITPATEMNLDGTGEATPQTDQVSQTSSERCDGGGTSAPGHTHPFSEPHEGAIRNNSSSASPTDSDDEEYEPQSVELIPVPTNATEALPLAQSAGHVSAIDTTVSDDLFPELQPQEDIEMTDQDQSSKPRSYYTPYKSVLAGFKDYRYHPNFLQEVPDGFKSLTYSHNIDPDKPLCPYEGAGGVCNDRACVYQHFSTMALTDNELLKLLGTHRTPAFTADEEKRWREGLGAVVRQLRTTNARQDAAAIAARIAQFRRDFVGDPTKVLNLGPGI